MGILNTAEFLKYGFLSKWTNQRAGAQAGLGSADITTEVALIGNNAPAPITLPLDNKFITAQTGAELLLRDLSLEIGSSNRPPTFFTTLNQMLPSSSSSNPMIAQQKQSSEEKPQINYWENNQFAPSITYQGITTALLEGKANNGDAKSQIFNFLVDGYNGEPKQPSIKNWNNKFWIDQTKFTPENISFTTTNADGEVLGGSISNGIAISVKRVLPSGTGASMENYFEPNAADFDPFTVNYTIKNTISSNTTQGTSSSRSTGGSSGGSTESTSTNAIETGSSSETSSSTEKSNTASWEVSSTITAETSVGFLGDGGKASASVTAGGGGSNTTTNTNTSSNTNSTSNTQSLSQSTNQQWQQTWDGVKGINFSAEKGTSKSTGETVSQTINISDLSQQEGDSFLLPNGQHLIAGQKYKVYVSYQEITVTNTIQGTYGIQGDIGTISDNQGLVLDRNSFTNKDDGYDNANPYAANNALVPNLSKYALSNGAKYVFGPAVQGFGEIGSNGEYIIFNGQASTTTTLGVNGGWGIAQVTDESNYQETFPENASSRSKSSKHTVYNLSAKQAHPSTGIFLDLSNSSNPHTKRLIGTGTEDTIHGDTDTSNKFKGNFSKSFLFGGKKGDKVVLQASESENTIELAAGKDNVKSKADFTYADLGSGNDHYRIQGGQGHSISTGSGKDIVRIEAAGSTWTIHDFDPSQDRLIFGDQIKSSQLKTRLITPDDHKHPMGSHLKITYGNELMGHVHFSPENKSMKIYTDSLINFNHKLINPKLFDSTEAISSLLSSSPHRPLKELRRLTRLEALEGNKNNQYTNNSKKLAKPMQISISKLGGKISQKEIKSSLEDLNTAPNTSQLTDLFFNELIPASGLNIDTF